MTADLSSSRLHAVVGRSLRLRDEVVQGLLRQWSGAVKRVIEPSDIDRIILDLDTPSLFSDPALWIVRGEGAWLRRHAEALARAIGPMSSSSGGILLVTSVPEDKAKSSGKNKTDTVAALFKLLGSSSALHHAEAPDAKEVSSWLCSRLSSHPQGGDRPLQVANALIAHVGDDCDALLAAVDLLAVYCDDRPIDLAAVESLITGTAEKPIWDYTGAILDGKVRRALELLYAGQGMEVQSSLNALIGEIRKLVACCETPDDGKVAELIGARGRPNLHYARSRARAIGRRGLVRMLHGCLLAQRQLRQTGMLPELIIEMLVLHAQKVVLPAGR